MNATAQAEHLNWGIVARVTKWDDFDAVDRLGAIGLQAAELRQVVLPTSDEVWSYGNLLTNGAGTGGINRMLNLLIVGGGQGMDHAHCRLGTGNGSTAVAITDTDLSAAAGSANRWFNMADTSYPSVATNVLTVVSTFATGDGNYAWNEWGIDFGTAASNAVTAPLLNRKVPGSSMGTKAAGATWALTVTITIT